MSLFSVVIPVYNGAKTVAACLDGLAAQSAAPGSFEIVVVDDGSTDATAAAVRAWIARHPEHSARLARQPNAGQSAARNHGARLARGAVLLFTDADCVPAPGWVAAFAAVFGQTLRATSLPPDAAMGRYVGSQPSPAARFAQLEFEERYALMARRAAQGQPLGFAATYSCAYRRDRFLALGGFDETLSNNEDVELAYRLARAGGRIVFVPGAAVAHAHDATWQEYAATKRGRAFWRTVVYRRFPGRAVQDGYTPQVLKLQLLFAPLAALGMAAALLARRARWLLAALPFLLTTLPMLRLARRLGSPAPPWVIWGAWLRAVAFAAGVAQALLTRRPPRRGPVPAGLAAEEAGG